MLNGAHLTVQGLSRLNAVSQSNCLLQGLPQVHEITHDTASNNSPGCFKAQCGCGHGRARSWPGDMLPIESAASAARYTNAAAEEMLVAALMQSFANAEFTENGIQQVLGVYDSCHTAQCSCSCPQFLCCNLQLHVHLFVPLQSCCALLHMLPVPGPATLVNLILLPLTKLDVKQTSAVFAC